MRGLRWIIALTLAAAWPAMAQQAPGPRATLSTGIARGSESADGVVRSFKGLPFAAPPVGPLRWKAPEAPLPWTEERDATAFGADCSAPAIPGLSGKRMSEDCLFLNVFSSGRVGGKQPVLVWFYGGGFIGGASSSPVFDGDALARRGVVVVTVNYRTGVMGYLAHPLLSRENGFAGNYGLLDQVAALQWVQRNIAAFGGDPARVTVSGQSSGGVIVNNLMSAPQAKGLFQQGIVMSGPLWGLTPPMRTREQAETIGSWFMANRGAKTLDEMRALPVEKLVANQPDEAALLLIPFQPITDNFTQIRSTAETFKLGWQAPVPLLIGATVDENSNSIPDQTRAQYEAWARELYGDAQAAEIMRLYPAASDGDGRWARIKARAASIMEGSLVEAQLHARIQPRTFLYRWDHVPPGPQAARMGAVHGGEVAYMFGTLDQAGSAFTDADRSLSRQMADYWANFVKTGNPNGPGLPRWAALTPATPNVMVFGDAPRAAPLTAAERRKLVVTRRLIDPAIYP
jgi:para-nitrobenzyl esterase